MSEAGFSLTRTFKAPRGVVFDAWVNPRQFAAWWGGAAVNVPEDTVSMDLRPGGAWKATMVLPDGNRMNWVGNYVEVDRPNKLIFTLTDNASSPNRETLTVIFTEIQDGTEIFVSQAGGFVAEEHYAATIAGYNTFFDVMQGLVES